MGGLQPTTHYSSHRVGWDVEVDLPGALHAGEEVAEVRVDLGDLLLERLHPLALGVLNLGLVGCLVDQLAPQLLLQPRDHLAALSVLTHNLEEMFLFNDRLNTFLFTVMWRQTR